MGDWQSIRINSAHAPLIAGIIACAVMAVICVSVAMLAGGG